MAFSRILDDTELLVALNLDTEPRTEFMAVDVNLTLRGLEGWPTCCLPGLWSMCRIWVSVMLCN